MLNKIIPFIFLLLMPCLAAHSQNFTQPPSEHDVSTGNLTDEEKLLMDNYTHAGYQKREADEVFEEECGKSEECQNIRNGGNATDGEKFIGMSPSMFRAVGQAYSMVMPAMAAAGKGSEIQGDTKSDVKGKWESRGMKRGKDGSYTMDNDKFKEWNDKNDGDYYQKDGKWKKTERTTENGNTVEKEVDADPEADAKADEEEADEDEGADYCQYIPMGTEIIAQATQKSNDEFALSTSPSIENSQSAALFKQARAHKDRKESVDIQRKGWGATTACYALMMMTTKGGMGVTDGKWQNWAKLAASGLMTKYYDWEYGMHDDASKKLNKIASKLSGKGACNPVSDRDCYCSQPETQNDIKYCFPQIRKRQQQAKSYQVVCVDNAVKEDVNCTCRQTNTCLDSRVQAKIDGMYVPGGIGGSLEEFYKLSNGISTPGDSSNNFKNNSGKTFAKANELLKSNINKVTFPDSFKKKNTEVANELKKLGLDATVAGALSAAPETKASKEAEKKLGSRRFRGGRNTSTKKYANYSKNKGIYFKGGKGLNKKKSKKKSASNPYAHLLKKKKKRGSSKSDILNFAQKAQANAGITKDKSRSIFDIISRRYKYSASKKLGIQ